MDCGRLSMTSSIILCYLRLYILDKAVISREASADSRNITNRIKPISTEVEIYFQSRIQKSLLNNFDRHRDVFRRSVFDPTIFMCRHRAD